MQQTFKRLILCSITALATLNAAYSMDLIAIKSAIKDTVRQQITLKNNEKIVIDVADNTIPLAYTTCTSPLEFKVPNNTHSEAIHAIEIGCSAQNWRSLVPVEVKIMVHALVAKQTLFPKSLIKEEDLEYAEFDKNHLYAGFFNDKNEVVGNVSNYMIAAGTLLTPKSIHPPAVIHRNQIITIQAKRNQIVVNMQGVAKSDGAQDAMIKVYNPSSKRTLDAVVINQNTAQVIS